MLWPRTTFNPTVLLLLVPLVVTLGFLLSQLTFQEVPDETPALVGFWFLCDDGFTLRNAQTYAHSHR